MVEECVYVYLRFKTSVSDMRALMTRLLAPYQSHGQQCQTALVGSPVSHFCFRSLCAPLLLPHILMTVYN